VEILHRRYYADNPDRLAGLEQARLENEVARRLYKLRQKAGLSQRELAAWLALRLRSSAVWKTPIMRAIPLAMLNRIAAVLHNKVS